VTCNPTPRAALEYLKKYSLRNDAVMFTMVTKIEQSRDPLYLVPAFTGKVQIIECSSTLQRSVRELISISWANELVGGYTTESVTHGQCDARPTVAFPAAEICRCSLAGTHFPFR